MTRRAVVTGGTRGIGEAICIALKDAGFTVLANYASRDEAAQAFKAKHGIEVLKWDVSSAEDCARGIAEAETLLGGNIEVLINNAGITRDAAMHKMSTENWNDVITTNLNSCYNMAKAVIDSMRENKFGRVISISSVNGQLGQFGQTNYSAAKAGIFGFTKALARETAAKGITVNAIAPGYIATEMVKAVPDNVMEQIVKIIPVGRLGEPEEISRAILFLAAEEASFITGETICINGGQYME
jgi:acetoacetyl-CoA reductase